MENKEKEVKVEETKEVKDEVKEEVKKDEKPAEKKNNKKVIITVCILGGVIALLLGYFVVAKVIFGDKGSSSSSSSSSSSTVKDGKNASTTATSADATCADATSANATSTNATASNATSATATASNATVPTNNTQLLRDKSKGLVYRNEELSDDQYNVPTVNIDSADSDSINTSIKNFITSLKNDSTRNTADYFITTNVNVLSVVITYKTPASDLTHYVSYMINSNTGSKFTNLDALSSQTMTFDACKSILTSVFNTKKEANSHIYDFYVENEALTAGEMTLNRINSKPLDDYYMFFNGNGELIAVIEEYNYQGNQGNAFLINVSTKEYENFNF